MVRDRMAIYTEARSIAAGRPGRARPRVEHLRVLVRLIDDLAALAAPTCPSPHCDGRGRLREAPMVGCAVCSQAVGGAGRNE